jgi:hypothetical protein
VQRPLGAFGVAALDQGLDEERYAERDTQRDPMGGEQLEPGAGVGLRLADRAAAQVHPATPIGEVGDGGDRLARPRVRERLFEARLGEVERVRGDQREHEVVERPDDVELLLVEQAPAEERGLEQRRGLARRPARAGALAGAARQHQSLPRSRALKGAAPLESPRRGRARLQAGLPGVRRELGLEEQRELLVLGLDPVDRRLEHLHAPVGLARDRERVGQLAGRRRELLRVADRLRAPPSSTSTWALSSAVGGSSNARTSRVVAAAGAPRASASAATRRSKSTRLGLPAGSDSAIWAAMRSSDAPWAASTRAARACTAARSRRPMSA